MKWTIAGGAFLGLACALGSLGVARGQSAQHTVERLNEEGMEAYHLMDVDRAAELLQRALTTGDGGRVTPQVLAITHRNLGVVYIGARSDEAAGQAQFLEGLCIDGTLELDPLTSTPQMQQAFERARAQANAGGCQGGAAATPGPGTSSVTAGPLPEAQAQQTAAAGSGYYNEQRLDEETPWDKLEREEEPGEMAPLFFQLGMSLGLSWITHGMTADRPPPLGLSFVEQVGPMQYRPVPNPVASFIQNRADIANAEGQTPLPGQPPPPIPPELRLLLPNEEIGTPLSAEWVPDADSEDAYPFDQGPNGKQPYGGPCSADGIPTGPALANPMTGDGLLPSKYCVRLGNPAFVPGAALRAALGYFVSDRVSLAAVWRFQFSAGQGDLASILLGARGEVLITQPRERGFLLSAFFGSTIGQIQAKVSDSQDGPWTVAGLFAGHAGVGARYRFHRHVGVFLAPELDIFFPDVLFHIDIPLGVEVAY